MIPFNLPVVTRQRFSRFLVAALPGLILLAPIIAAAAKQPAPESEFVNIRDAVPGIVIDLRYAGVNNVTQRPLYAPDMPALVRVSVASRLLTAQQYLMSHGHGLKIWDAYRPKSAQERLWELTRNNSYVADPKDRFGSMHARGVAVDATLVDTTGREVPMPTDFDNFTPAAMLYYQGSDPGVRANLHLLQIAMAHAGFYALRTEWWHFCAPDWTNYAPVADIKLISPTKSPVL